MLDGVGSVRWDDHAVADWLVRLADAVEDDKDEIDDEFPPTLLRDSVVGSDAAAAVPFLIRLSGLNPAYRDYLAGVVAQLVSADHDTPGTSARVRAAVASDLKPVIAWATDRDATTRTSAYLILARCRGPAAALRQRWVVETDRDARLALLLALGACDPDALDAVLWPALRGGAPGERLAAALALHRAGLELPAGSGRLVAEAVRAGGTLGDLFLRDPLDEILTGSRNEDFVTAFLTTAITPGPDTTAAASRVVRRDVVAPPYRAGVDALWHRCRTSRSAPDRCLPLLRPLLANGDEHARQSAFRVVHAGGRAAALLADACAATVQSLPEEPDGTGIGSAHYALATLQRLNDPRWVPALCRTWAAGLTGDLPAAWLSAESTFAPVGVELVAELGDALHGAVDRGQSFVVSRLVDTVERATRPGASCDGQRRALAGLEPALRAALPVAVLPVRRALHNLGVATAADLHALIAAGGDDRAAVELLRSTGESGPYLAALRRRREANDTFRLVRLVRDALPANPGHLAAVASAIRALHNDSPVTTVRTVTAHLLHRAGQPEPGRSIVRTGLAGDCRTATHAAALAADQADPSLERLLRRHLGCGQGAAAVATALVAIGVPRADVTDPVITWIAGCGDPDVIIRVCRDTLDPTAIPRLRELADTDQRARLTGEISTAIWRDEAHRDAVRTTVTHLDAGP